MITIGTVLNLLEESVRRGRLPCPPGRSAPGTGASHEVSARPAAHDSIAVEVAAGLGVPRADIDCVLGDPPDLTLTRTPAMTFGAVMALRAAAASQSRGETCESVLGCAWSAANRLLDLVPDGLVQDGLMQDGLMQDGLVPHDLVPVLAPRDPGALEAREHPVSLISHRRSRSSAKRWCACHGLAAEAGPPIT